MKKMMLACVSIAGVVLLSASFAAAGQKPVNVKKEAAKQCKAEKKVDKAAFRSVYGKNAMRDCVRLARGEVREEKSNAAKECKAERKDDADAFEAAYGDRKNAFGKCVSSTVKQDRREDTKEFKSAAKQCKAERRDDPSAFEDEYGSRKNALGKCVSSNVKEDDSTEAR